MSTPPKPDGGPAFPQHGWSKDPEVLARMQESCGISMRDYFAAAALQGMIAGKYHQETMHNPANVELLVGVAWCAYAMADAMLEARMK